MFRHISDEEKNKLNDIMKDLIAKGVLKNVTFPDSPTLGITTINEIQGNGNPVIHFNNTIGDTIFLGAPCSESSLPVSSAPKQKPITSAESLFKALF